MLIVHSDGCHRPDTNGVGIGWVIKEWQSGGTPEQVSEGNDFIEGSYTSVEAEYMALIRAAREAVEYATDLVIFYCDCEPVINKIYNNRELADDGKYLRSWNISKDRFDDYELLWIPREHNGVADSQARVALDRKR